MQTKHIDEKDGYQLKIKYQKKKKKKDVRPSHLIYFLKAMLTDLQGKVYVHMGSYFIFFEKK